MAKERKKKADRLWSLVGLVLGIVHIVLEIVLAIMKLLLRD